jgi:hypothetical protein
MVFEVAWIYLLLGVKLISNNRILAHRGLWLEPNEKNSTSAILRAIESGFSVEIDLRDSFGEVVVAHDPVTPKDSLTLRDLCRFIDELVEHSTGQVLALDVKSDGLHKLSGLDTPKNLEHFFFDMSIPELIQYKSTDNLNTATRWSEFEDPLILLEAFSDEWVWMDCFRSDWWLRDPKALSRLRDVSQGSRVVIVSPELHGRDPEQVWDYFTLESRSNQNLYICTDHPERVRDWSSSAS